MRLVILVPGRLCKRLLFKLRTRQLIGEVLGHVNRGRHRDAIVAALIKGSYLGEIEDSDLCHTEADLILSPTNAMWDLKIRDRRSPI
jgi:hypothetical protein